MMQSGAQVETMDLQKLNRSCELHPLAASVRENLVLQAVWKASAVGKFGGWGAVSGSEWSREGLERLEFSGLSAVAAGRCIQAEVEMSYTYA